MKPGYEPIPDSVRRLRNPALDLDREAVALEVMTLRRLLAFAYCASEPGLYGDDGELQLGGYPHPIDFNRDAAEKIEQSMHARGMQKLIEAGIAKPAPSTD